ncbi:MAG: adenosylcobinamide-phosphate synthase CbiB [Bariatricus sp.]
MRILCTCVTGFLLDAIWGDPVWLYHPVRLIGRLIEIMEKVLRAICRKTDRALHMAGIVLWFAVVIVSTGVPVILLYFINSINPWLAFVVEIFWCFQIFAGKSLKTESRKVYDRLKEHDLPGARYAVSMIVGRDTENLSEQGVTKAAVETVAENTSDGVIAPLFYLMIGGAPLGFFYKAVNTMDSMVGYKNEKYLYFGRFAAKMDDLFNYIPARLSAFFMILSAFCLGMDGKGALRIYLRDRRKHASPNSAQTEAVCAGALGVQLAGDAFYFGKLYHKETIGDPVREIEAEDIVRAGRLMDGTAVLTLIVLGLIRIMVL